MSEPLTAECADALNSVLEEANRAYDVGFAAGRAAARPSGLGMDVPGHEAMPEGKTERDWAFRAHCKADGEAWPCRSVLLATLDAARPSGEVDVERLSATLASLEGKEELHILDAYSYDEAAGIIVAEYDALRYAAIVAALEDRT